MGERTSKYQKAATDFLNFYQTNYNTFGQSCWLNAQKDLNGYLWLNMVVMKSEDKPQKKCKIIKYELVKPKREYQISLLQSTLVSLCIFE